MFITWKSLKAAIVNVVGNMQEAPHIHTCNRLSSHIEPVIEVEEGFIEKTLNRGDEVSGVCVNICDLVPQ